MNWKMSLCWNLVSRWNTYVAKLDWLDILHSLIHHHIIVTRLWGRGNYGVYNRGIHFDPDLFTPIMYVNNDHSMALVWQSIRNEGGVAYRCDIYILPTPNHLVVWWVGVYGAYILILFCLAFDFECYLFTLLAQFSSRYDVLQNKPQEDGTIT